MIHSPECLRAITAILSVTISAFMGDVQGTRHLIVHSLDLVSSLTLVQGGCKMPPNENGNILHLLCTGVNDHMRCKEVENQDLGVTERGAADLISCTLPFEPVSEVGIRGAILLVLPICGMWC